MPNQDLAKFKQACESYQHLSQQANASKEKLEKLNRKVDTSKQKLENLNQKVNDSKQQLKKLKRQLKDARQYIETELSKCCEQRTLVKIEDVTDSEAKVIYQHKQTPNAKEETSEKSLLKESLLEKNLLKKIHSILLFHHHRP